MIDKIKSGTDLQRFFFKFLLLKPTHLTPQFKSIMNDHNTGTAYKEAKYTNVKLV